MIKWVFNIHFCDSDELILFQVDQYKNVAYVVPETDSMCM